MSTTAQRSLGATVAEFVALGAAIGQAIAAGEHLDLDGHSQAGLAADLVAAAGLGQAGSAVLAKACRDSGDLKQSGFFSVKTYLRDGVGVSGSTASQVQRLGTVLDRYPCCGRGCWRGGSTPTPPSLPVAGSIPRCRTSAVPVS